MLKKTSIILLILALGLAACSVESTTGRATTPVSPPAGPAEDESAVLDDTTTAEVSSEEAESTTDDGSSDSDAPAFTCDPANPIALVNPGDKNCTDNASCFIVVGKSGGSTELDWGLASSLPTGMHQSGSSISGIPHVSGTFEITVTVEDTFCETAASTTFTLTVAADVESYEPPTVGETFSGASSDETSALPIFQQVHVPVHLSASLVTRVIVDTKTGRHSGSNTDKTVSLTLCGQKASSGEDVANCFHVVPLGSDFPTGATRHSEITVFALPEQAAYWRLHANGEWMVQGLKITYEITDFYTDGSSVVRKQLAYWNPCLNQWLHDSSLALGPDDTAVCAIVETGSDEDHAGTDDDVYLTFQNSDYDNYRLGNHSPDAYHEGPYAHEGKNDGLLKFHLNWRNWKTSGGYSYDAENDFVSGQTTTYGMYSFDKDPIVRNDDAPKGVRIEKKKDGTHGGWFLQGFWVYVYKPAKSFAFRTDSTTIGRNPDAAQEDLFYFLEKPYYEDWLSDSYGNQTPWFSSFSGPTNTTIGGPLDDLVKGSGLL